MDEQGEEDLEDGYGAEECEFEQEEAEDEDEELVSDEDDGIVKDSDDEEIPKAIPIDRSVPAINHEKRDPEQEMPSSEVSDINVDSFSESSDYDQDQLDPNSTANPHGFMYSNMLDTFSKSRRDRIDDLKQLKAEQYEEHRDRFKRKQNKNLNKKLPKSEKVHQKNKPFMMVKKKKIEKLRESIKTINTKKRADKRQMGHFRKATKQRIEAKRRGKK